MTADFIDELEDSDHFDTLPLAGLPFKHVHLSLTFSGGLPRTRDFVMWWSLTLRALSKSKATIYFTELTFSFNDLEEIDSLKSACQSLDDSLAHPMLSAVRSIHFEDNNGFSAKAVADKYAVPFLN